MLGKRALAGRLIRGLVGCVLLMPVLSACTAVAGGGVIVAAVAIGALTSHCYDYLDVSVFDVHGRKTCTATVTATNGGDEFELQSCYYAPLSDGHWTLRASLPGATDAVTVVEVEHLHDCTRHTQSVELSLAAQGAAPRARLLAPTPSLVPESSTKPAPAPLPAATAAPGSAPSQAAPVPVPATPPSTAASSAPPASAASSVAPSVGVFPNPTEAAH